MINIDFKYVFTYVLLVVPSVFECFKMQMTFLLAIIKRIFIWGVFEIITLGEFGNLISTFDLKTRQDIAKDIGFNIYKERGRSLRTVLEKSGF